MRWIAAAVLLALAGAAQAQSPLTGTQGPLTATPPVAAPAAPAAAAPAPRRRGRTLQERFDEANATHDGHLTKEQARAKMPAVARDFDAIDKEHAGFVTVDQIKAHAAEQRAARRAAKKTAAPQ